MSHINPILIKLQGNGICNIEPKEFHHPGHPEHTQRLVKRLVDWKNTSPVKIAKYSQESHKEQYWNCSASWVINDLGDNLSPESSLKLFADDGLLFRIIEDVNHANALQTDLDKLLLWSNNWQMNFHTAKCYIMTIANKRNLVTHDYTILA